MTDVLTFAMESCSNSLLYTLPAYASNDVEDIHKIEAAASKALERIHSLYNEIMTSNTASSYLIESEAFEYSKNWRTGKENRCCVVFGDLCSTCEKVVSRCKSCNKCDCSAVSISSKTYSEQKYTEHLQKDCTSNLKNYPMDLNAKLKVTTPRPFSISIKNAERQNAKEYKISKLKEELNNRIENELKIRIRSKPVPKHTYLPLYNEMVKLNEKRKNERREKCLQLSKGVVKPFNLSAYNKSSDLKSKSVSDLTSGEIKYVFKAKPIPKNILSDKVSEKLKNKEEIRKLLIAQRAEDILKQSSLPFSQKNIIRSHSLIDLNYFNKKSCVKKVKSKNLSAITDRLYTKKCKEVIDCWNEKVLQIDNLEDNVSKMKINDTIKSKLGSPVEPFPFFHFPVRMSSAAMLRERQIRTEILTRKQKIEQEKNIDEKTAQKRKEIQRNILPRLKDLDPTIDSQKEIDEKVKSFRASQKSRKQEYDKELQKMMKRVSKQLLLMERQSMAMKENFNEVSDNSESDKQSAANSDGTSEEISSDNEGSSSSV